jgi:energy-coupling factor transport system permease protein
LHESVLGPLEYGMFALFGLFLVLSLVAYFGWGVGKFGWLIF